MDILSYLTELIQTHKEVGLPNLGTFFKKKSPGRYDANLHSFLPPSYLLQFKTEVSESSLLAAHISQQHHISVESANYYIEQFTLGLKKQLTDHKQADLSPLGKLISENGLTSFHPEKDLQLGFEFYGLPSVQEQVPAPEQTDTIVPEVETVVPHHDAQPQVQDPEEEKNLQEEELVPAPENNQEEFISAADENENPSTGEAIPEVPLVVIPPSSDPLPVNEPIVNTPFYKDPVVPDEEQRKSTPLYLILILTLLVLLIIFMGLFLLKPQFFDQLVKQASPAAEQQKPVLPNPVKDSLNKPVDSLPKKETVKKDTLAAKVSPSKDSVNLAGSATTIAQPAEQTTYEVIGSSVANQQEADRFIEFMKRKWGVNATIVSHRKGKKIKISIASYKDKATADAEKIRLEEKIKITGLYVFTNTHKPE